LNLESKNELDPRQLGAVLLALRALHKTLVAGVQLGFEKLHGRVQGPGELLSLLLNDPLFAWLRPLSQLITELDDLVDGETPIDAASLLLIRSTIERWLTDPTDDFAANYLSLLQSDPDVVLAHAALRKELANLSPTLPSTRKDLTS
jgi:hypothetical protein